MVRVKINKKFFSDRYWMGYTTESGVSKQVSLSSCANNFRLATDNRYDTGNGLQCIGWRYEEAGNLCYELFCVGHLQLYMPLQPGLKDMLLCLLKGKKIQEGYQEKLKAFELALNQRGWKVVERPAEDREEHGK